MPADQPDNPPFLSIITKRIRFSYTNYRGETSVRVAEPTDIRFGSTERHPDPQWLMSAFDFEKDGVREFAMKDMSAVVVFND